MMVSGTEKPTKTQTTRCFKAQNSPDDIHIEAQQNSIE